MNFYISVAVFLDGMIGWWCYLCEEFRFDLLYAPFMFALSIFSLVMQFYLIGGYIFVVSVLKFLVAYMSTNARHTTPNIGTADKGFL